MGSSTTWVWRAHGNQQHNTSTALSIAKLRLPFMFPTSAYGGCCTVTYYYMLIQFFDRYRSLYETAALAIPITAIYPLSRIVQRLSKAANVEAPLTVVCLFVWLFITQMIYYFGHWTSAADGFFYFLMLLPASKYLA